MRPSNSLRRAIATGQREIVTRTLALRAELLGGGPHQRMEPVERAREPTEGVSDQIVTTNVRQLVQQDSASTVERPRVTLGREHYSRRQQPAGKRHPRVFAAQQTRRLLELEAIRDFVQRAQPIFGC